MKIFRLDFLEDKVKTNDPHTIPQFKEKIYSESNISLQRANVCQKGADLVDVLFQT